MTTVCTDEHVPNVFVTTLRSMGFGVEKATDVFGEGTDDKQLLEYCAEHDHVFVTHDKKDFAGDVGESIDHAGIVARGFAARLFRALPLVGLAIYTDPAFLRDEPESAARILERVFEYYSREDLHGERIWLDQWRR